MQRSLFSVMVLAGLTLAAPLAAQEEQADEESMRVTRPRLGLDPGAPTNPSGALSINNGYEPTRSDDWVFNFHGMLQAPIVFTVGDRDPRSVVPNQSDTVFHSPSFYPGSNPKQFAWTGAIPKEFVQIAMTYGSTGVNGSVILNASDIGDAFVTVDLTESLGQMIQVTVGNFRTRYGIMGEHDLGRYGTPLFVDIDQSGETVKAAFEVDDMAFVVEQGLGFPGVNAQSPTVTAHLHGAFSYAHLLQLGLHYLNTNNVSDNKPAGTQPLPPLPQTTLIGAEARLTAKQFGHLYVGVGKHTFNDLVPVTYPQLSPGYKVLNAEGGTEIVAQYLGRGTPIGTGGLLVAGAQYDLSVGNIMFPELEGYGPDIFASLFGMYTKTDSPGTPADGKSQTKFGVEATYAMMSWLAAGVRADVVSAYQLPAIGAGASDVKFQMISPRAIFKSDWNSNDQLVLQYTRVNYGRGTIANNSEGAPSLEVYQDENIITAYGSVWW